jgi:hypothetical protein
MGWRRSRRHIHDDCVRKLHVLCAICRTLRLDLVARCPIPDGEIEVREIFDIGDRPDDIKAPALEFAEKLAKPTT